MARTPEVAARISDIAPVAPATIPAPSSVITIEAVEGIRIEDNTNAPADDVREVEVEVREIGTLTVETYR